MMHNFIFTLLFLCVGCSAAIDKLPMSDQWWPSDVEEEEVVGWFAQIYWVDEQPSHGSGIFLAQYGSEEQCWIDWQIDISGELDCDVCTFAVELTLELVGIEVDENCEEYLPQRNDEFIIPIGYKEPHVYSYIHGGWLISGEGEYDEETDLFEFFIEEW